MESGQTKSPSFPIGILLARELGVTPEYSAFGDDGTPGRSNTAPPGGDMTAEIERRLIAVGRAIAKQRR